MSLHPCPYCADPAAFGLLPAREVTFDTSHRYTRLDYGTRSSVRSLVHLERNGSRSIVGGIRCYNDKNAVERIAEDAAAKPLNAVETAGV
jgi:hypothetical protein